MRRRLAAALLRARLLRHPAAGASWEGFVIEQLLGALAAHGVDANPHCLRTSDGNEIDLLLALGGTTIAVEVKLAAGAAPQDLARLERAADLVFGPSVDAGDAAGPRVAGPTLQALSDSSTSSAAHDVTKRTSGCVMANSSKRTTRLLEQ